MNLYIPPVRSAVSDTIERSWNMASQPGNSITQEIDVGKLRGRLSMAVYFADLSHPEDKHWRSVFIPLVFGSEVGISITWWARRSGLAGSTNIKSDTLGKWMGVLKSKTIGGGYTINSLMCPPKSHLPSRSKWLATSGYEENQSWFPSYGFDDSSSIAISEDDFYAGMLSSNGLIFDFLKFFTTREDLIGVLERFEMSPLTFFGVSKGPEIVGLASFKKALVAALTRNVIDGDIRGEFKPAAVTIESVAAVKPSAKEEMYAGVWGAFG